MKKSLKKIFSVCLAGAASVSCFAISASAAELDWGEILHFLYYKDAPWFLDLLDKVYVVFWDMLIGIINLFM